MTDYEECAYFRRRAEQADTLADKATDRHIKQIHRVMAIDYRAMADESKKLSLVRPRFRVE